MDVEEDVSAIEEVGRESWSFDRSTSLLRFLCSRSEEVPTFHVASTRFWEAVLLPCAVVVVVALSSCMEIWIGQCVSLACWYAANYYLMGYTLQVLHPQHSNKALLWLSPFGGGWQLALWSLSLALLEVALLHSIPTPGVAHAVGTTLYAACGCLWLHLFIAPWSCIPGGWRPQFLRWGESRWEKRAPEVASTPRKRERAEGSMAGHAALAIAGYALLSAWGNAGGAVLWREGTKPPLQPLQSKIRPQIPHVRPRARPPRAQRPWDSYADNSSQVAQAKRQVPGQTPTSGAADPSRNTAQDGARRNSASSDGARRTRQEASRRLHAEGLQLESSSELSAKSTSWDGVVLLGALALVLVMFLDVGKSMEFSVPHLVCYNLVCLRVPDVLGHWVVMTVAGLQMSPGTTTTAISFAYMGAMQAYLVALKWVCRHMSAPDMFPRFHFIAQMYYYLFWYMMLMVLAPGGVDDRNFWMMVVFLNGTSLVSNAGVLSLTRAFLRPGSGLPDPPLKVLFDSKLAVQDQLADVVSLLVVPAIATSFHICTSLRVPNYPIGPLLSLWQRFLVLLLARLLSGLLTEEIFRRRVDVLNKAEALELQLLPIDGSQNRTRYLSDICIGPKLALEAMRNIERCELYFATVAVVCTFAVFQKGDWPARYAFIAFGM